MQQPLIERTESKAMRREVTLLCVVFMCANLLISGFSGLSMLALNKTSGGLPDTTMLDESGLLLTIGIYFLQFAVPLAVFFLIVNRQKTSEYFKTGAPKFFPTLAGAFGVLAINYVFTVFSYAGNIAFGRIGVLGTIDSLEFTDSPLNNVLFFFFLVIFPAFMEEFTFRGVMTGRLMKYNSTLAVVFSALCFGLMHLTVDQIPFAFCAGLIMGLVYIRTGSIWSTVIIHAVNNGFYYIEKLFYSLIADQWQAEKYFMLFFFGIFIIGIILMTALLLSKKSDVEKGSVSYPEASRSVLLNPVFIIVFIVSLCVTALMAVVM